VLAYNRFRSDALPRSRTFVERRYGPILSSRLSKIRSASGSGAAVGQALTPLERSPVRSLSYGRGIVPTETVRMS
jgi:hypothetical protein